MNNNTDLQGLILLTKQNQALLTAIIKSLPKEQQRQIFILGNQLAKNAIQKDFEIKL